jgi:NHL repeat
VNRHITNQGDKVTPTEHTAKPAAAPKTGRFALLRGPHPAPGSSALSRSFATPLIALCALFAVLALSTAAQAEAPKLISFGTFGSSAPLAVGVAVDQSSGDVYVTGLFDELNPNLTSSIDKFDASGKLLSPPSPFGEGFYSAAAVNPASGDVYVLQAGFLGPTAIDTFDPSSGALLSSFSVPESLNFSGAFTAVQIATDSAGDVYIPVTPNNEVLEYDPATCPAAPEPCVPLKTFAGSGAGKLSEPTGVAVDSAGNLWVADVGNNRIEELSAAGAFLSEIKSEGVQAVALGAHGEVFALVDNSADFCGSLEPPCSHLVEYSSAGVQIADIGAGSFGAAEQNVPSMVAVNDSSGRVYVTDGLKNLVWIFGPPSAPVVDKELDAEAGTSEAKLGAFVNPGGIETSYRFEYDTREYKQGEGRHGISVPFPEGNVGQGVTPRTVWASASGLAPGTTYHYRVSVSNELGTVVGPDQTFTTETAAQASCPNEQLRGGFAANLPDCRAYELVTPPTKTSSQPDTIYYQSTGNNHAARDGNRMSYTSIEIQPGPRPGPDYLSTRGVNGWMSESVLPLQSYTGERCSSAGTDAYSADLSKAVLLVGRGETPPSGTASSCGAEGLEVVSGEPLGVENLLLRDNATGAYGLLNLTPPGVTPVNAEFKGASADLGHVVFTEQARLTADAPAGIDDLYEWSGGVVRLVTVLPSGAPVAGSFAGLSTDGSHIFFSAGGALYVRLNGSSTSQVDASQAGGSGGGGQFRAASADGSRVFFTDENRLTVGSTAAPGEPDLYEYDVDTGRLSDLTIAQVGEHANVRGVIGASEDGTYVYFIAAAVLSGAEANDHGESARSGQSNLYLSHSGTIAFIADTQPESECGEVRFCSELSPNGAFLAFTSTKTLTGYDNTDMNNGEADNEIFLYSAASNQLVCTSCNPSGERPSGFKPETNENGEEVPEQFGGAAVGGMSESEHEQGGAPHQITNSGRLFFNTAEALLPGDTNGHTDVYEYEDGQLHLISTGTSSSGSVLLDISESGDDVFFLTRQNLVPQATEEEAQGIYDARVDGGFPAPSSPPPCTTADACRAPVSPQPSIYGAPSSQTFSGAGNLTPPLPTLVKVTKKTVKCKRGFVKNKKGKCVRKKSKKQAKRASHNRRGK